MVGNMGAHGQLKQSAILRNPRTKYKLSNNVYLVRSIALNCAHICAQLLQFFLQSPMVVPVHSLQGPEGSGTGQITWRIELTKKMRGHRGEKKFTEMEK